MGHVANNGNNPDATLVFAGDHRARNQGVNPIFTFGIWQMNFADQTLALPLHFFPKMRDQIFVVQIFQQELPLGFFRREFKNGFGAFVGQNKMVFGVGHDNPLGDTGDDGLRAIFFFSQPEGRLLDVLDHAIEGSGQLPHLIIGIN